MNDKEAKMFLDAFYRDNTHEEANDRYLLSAGKLIVPHLAIEVQKKDMPKRLYAVVALGKIGDKRALAVLTKILEDHNEVVDFRAEALCSIWYVDRNLGRELAEKHASEHVVFKRAHELLNNGRLDDLYEMTLLEKIGIIYYLDKYIFIPYLSN